MSETSKRKPPHNVARLVHAIRKFKRRYGREIDKYQIHALIELAIQNKVRSKITGSTPGTEEVLIDIGDLTVRMIYFPHTREVVTFLPIKNRHKKKGA